MQPRMKKRSSWQSFCLSQENQAPRENLILCPHFRLKHANFTVTTFIEGCSRSHPGRSDAAADFLRLPVSDVVVWTDDSVPSLLGAGGPVSTWPAEDAYSPLHCGPFSSRFPAESLALVRGLEWCHFHLNICHFQSILFLTDSQSALALLSTAPAFPQPKCFWNIWDLSDFLSSRVAISFQWVPGHAKLPGNELADALAKTEATLSFAHVPSPLDPVIAKIRHTRYTSWRRNLSSNSLFSEIPSVSSEELSLPRFARCEMSRLHCHDHSLLLSSYLCRIKRKENYFCSTCGHRLQYLTHLLLDCPASEPRARHV